MKHPLSDESEDFHDCTAFACALEEAREELAEACRRRAEVETSTARVRAAIERYFDQAYRFRAVVTDQADAARAFVLSRLDNLEEYRGLAIPTDWVRPAGASQPSRPSQNAGQPAKSLFRELGIVSVQVAAIDVSDSTVRSAADFAKVSYEEMLEGVQRFVAEVQPKVGQGAGADYFFQKDCEEGRDYEHGLQRLFDAFYGDGRIRLTRLGSRYVITNGQHRVFIARQLGLATLPASVAEQIALD